MEKNEQLEFPEEEQENLPVQTQSQITAPEILTRETLEKKLAEAKLFVEYQRRIRDIALGATDPQDWILHEGKPYLQDGGVAKVLKTVGASTRNFSDTREQPRQDEKGRVDVYYEVTGEILDKYTGLVYTNKGMSNTRDKFFAERWREKKDGNGNVVIGDDKKPVREKYLLKLDEMNLSNVKKKAVTNLKHRLLNDAFRLNPTKEDLEKHFGEKFKLISGFSYGKGTQGGSPDSAEAKELRTKLRNLILEIVGDDKAAARKLLQDETKFPGKAGKKDFPGYAEVDKVSLAMLKKTYDKILKNQKDGKYK